MIRCQIQATKLPIRSAAGRRGQINTAALMASVALIAHTLSACSGPPQSVPIANAATPYPDLNDPPASVPLRADDAAQLKARLIALREDQERAAAEQQAPHQAGGIEPLAPIGDEPPDSTTFTFRR
jgi:hypothetical protein